MSSLFASRGNQCSENASIDDIEYESTSEFSPGPESDGKEEEMEDELRLEQSLPPVIKTKAMAKQKTKVKKKSWWRKVWSKSSQKKRKKKRKRKKRKSTVSMLRHHHATFAHLIHDVFLRLKCSHIHRSGYSHKQILKNIERHYRLKLGKKFKVRLQLSFERLVAKGLLISIGSKNKGLKYKPSVAFLKKIARLKVIDGAANLRYGVEIGKYRSRGRSRGRSRSRSHRRRSHSRRRRRRRRRRKRRGRRKRGRGWTRTKHRAHGRARHRGKKTKSKKGSSSNYFGGSIRKWLWPSKEDKVEGEKNAKAEAHNEERKTYSKHMLGKWKHMPMSQKRNYKSGRDSNGCAKGSRYGKFQRLRIRERQEKPVLLTPMGSLHLSKVDSHYVASEASEGSLDPIDNFHYETPPSSMSDIDKDADEDMSNTTSEGSTPMVKNRSRKEHDRFHAMKERSRGLPSRRSLLEKVRDSLRGAFGSDRTSTTTCEGGPSRPQDFSKTPSSTQRPLDIGPQTSEPSASPN